MLKPAMRGSAAVALLAIALAAVAADFLGVLGIPRFSRTGHMAVAAGAAMLGLVVLSLFTVPREAVGWRLLPRQGVWYWCKTIAVVAGICAAFCLLVLLTRPLTGIRFEMSGLRDTSNLWPWFLNVCIVAPVTEEIVYRGLLCPPLAALAGPWTAIFVSGALFAAAHFASGNPGPDNFIAGYLLAWVYLKSESLTMPIVVHGLGNLVMVLWRLLLTYHPEAASVFG